MKERLPYIDVAKGIAIILMIWTHTVPGDSISTWVFSFHMPIFFIISGILMSKRDITNISLTKFITKRSIQLGLPYFIFCFILCLFYGLLNYSSTGNFDTSGRFYQMITLNGVDSLWFIPCMFFADFFMLISLKMCTKYVYILMFTIILVTTAMSSFIGFDSLNDTARLTVKVAVSFSFVIAGYLVNQTSLLQSKGNKSLFFSCFLCFVCFSYFQHFNGFVGLGALQLNNVFLYYINAFVLSCSLLAFVQYLSSLVVSCGYLSKILSVIRYYGENTIVLLCTNNLLIEIIRLMDYRLANNWFLAHALYGSCVMSLIILLIEIPLIEFSKSKFGIVFGRK